MGFKIAHQTKEVDLIWGPIDMTTQTSLYVGQLVQNSTGGMNGFGPLAVASGLSDLGGDQQIAGIVVGTNNYPRTGLFDATYGAYIASAGTPALQKAIAKLGNGGMWAKGDPQPLVQVALIDSTTWIEAPLYYTTYGTPTQILTTTAVTASGAGFTTNATDVATVANLCTFYCRTGENAGLYRVAKTAHATVHTFDTYWPYTLAIGDTFVCVPFRVGTSYANINEAAGYLGMCFRTDKTPATHYFGIFVKELDLKESGKEKVIFRFDTAAFGGIR